jgi:hypothetical protein
MYKDYDEGKNPYVILTGNEDHSVVHKHAKHTTIPWCPPRGYEYEGMLSHNKLMMILFKKEEELAQRLQYSDMIVDSNNDHSGNPDSVSK